MILFRRLGLVLLLLGSPGALAWAQTVPASGARLDRVVLQLKWKHQFQFAGYYAAIQKGYYREAGLEVELVEAQPGQDPVEAVQEGRAEFGVGTSELMLLRAKGAPVVVLAVMFQHSPLVLIARGESETDLHALHDRPMMIEPQSAELFAYFRNEGVNPDTLRIVPHTFSMDDLIAGKVGAMSGYSTDEPFLLQRSGLRHSVFSPRAGGIDFYGDNLFTTEAQIRGHPARVRAFRAACLRGWEYALAHPEEIVDLILREHGPRKSREHLLFEAGRTRQLMHPELIQVGHMNPGRWRHIADTYAEFGMIPEGFPVGDMLYDPDPHPDLRPWYWAMGIAAALTIAALGWLVPLVRLNRRLKRGERQYRQLAENAPFPVVISDLDSGLLLFANRLAADVLEGTPAALSSRPAVEFYTDPEDREHLIESLVTGRAVAAHEIRLQNLRGKPFWALLSAGLVEFGGKRCIVVAFNDITRRHEIQEELRRAKEEAEAANTMRNRYLAVMSHEIRTPMNGIHGLTELMLRDEALGDAQRENMEMMRTAAHGLLRLVNELLDWSQLEAGAIPLENSPVVLEDFVRQIEGLFRPATEAKGLELAHAIAADVPPVIVTDALRLRQILSNLLSNAIKFTERGRVALAVETVPAGAGTGKGRRIRFVVTDTGPGIPPETRKKLFSPYVQADAAVARRFGGAGLGLSISRGLARLLGGDLTLWSDPGVGSTFTVEIGVRLPDGI